MVFMASTPKHMARVSSSWAWSQQWEIPSETGAGRSVLEAVLAQLQEHGWSEDDQFGVHLSVEEALVNAIKHGNRYHPDKVVRVQACVSAERMEIEIEDSGDGFNPADVPDPTLEENLEVPSGRGLMLMRSFMSQVEYRDRGNRVWMEKQRSPDG